MKTMGIPARHSGSQTEGDLLIISYEEISSYIGLNTRIRGIARALSATGRHVEIAAPSYRRHERQPPADIDGIPIHVVPVPDLYSRWTIPIVTRAFSTLLLTVHMVRQLRRLPKRFAWVQAEQAYPFPAACLLARKWGAKVILDDPSLLAQFVKEKLRHKGILKPLLIRAVEAFEHALWKRADCILCSSGRTAGEIHRRKNGARARVHRLDNGVDLDEFTANSNGGPGNRIFFNCSVPYYQNVAALRNLLRILVHFENEGFNNYSAVIIVNNTGTLPAEVMRAIESTPRVQLLSNQKSLVPWLRQCDFVLLPYETGHLTTAGSRLKVFEALACGKIVLGTKEALDEIPDWIDGKNVVLCSDWRDMARKTMDLIQEGETPRKLRLQSEARRFVERGHSWSILARVYESILDRSGADEGARVIAAKPAPLARKTV